MYKQLVCALLLLGAVIRVEAQARILFDNVKGETSGTTADWTIDADLHDINWGSQGTAYTCNNGCVHSDPQRLPTPAQSQITSSTTDTFWTGALSSWGIDLVKQGFIVESLPYTGSITYGSTSNAQDLTHYKVFVMCEPNTHLTTAEKTALVSFVQNGGGLYMISDHNGSDRNFDGWDSPHIWMDFAVSTGNPFGIMADTVNVSPTTTSLPRLPNDSCLHGPLGSVTGIKYHQGTTFTIDPTVNTSVVGIAYNSGTSGNTGVLAGHARYGRGKVAFLGDSSPCDDGTGNPNSTLTNSYTADLSGSHRKLLVNTTMWLAAGDSGIMQSTMSVSHDTTICEGQQATLSASGASGYTWAPGGSTTQSITVSPTTNTNYTVTGIVNGTAQVLTIRVTVQHTTVVAFSASASGANVSISNQCQNGQYYNWNYGDQSPTVNAITPPTHTYAHSGVYTITLIATNGCGADTLTHQVHITIAGINEPDAEGSVNIYQSGSDEVRIEYPSRAIDRDVYIYSITGQQVLKAANSSDLNPISVNIAALPAGLYILRVGDTVKKINKQ